MIKCLVKTFFNIQITGTCESKPFRVNDSEKALLRLRSLEILPTLDSESKQKAGSMTRL